MTKSKQINKVLFKGMLCRICGLLFVCGSSKLASAAAFCRS